MDEKIFSEWKEDNAELYAKFKVDLEEQLKKPYHQTILDMSEGNIEPLQSVIADISDIISKDGIDIDKLYTKAIETGDTSTYCLCCYLLFDNGEDQLAKAILEKIEEPGTQEIINAARDYKHFYNRNLHQETTEVTNEEMNLLTLRRWHYEHPEEYKEFIATFQKTYSGDMTFFLNNTFYLMEMLSINGVKEVIKIVASMIPGNKYHQQSLMDTDSNPLKKRLSIALDSSLNCS